MIPFHISCTVENHNLFMTQVRGIFPSKIDHCKKINIEDYSQVIEGDLAHLTPNYLRLLLPWRHNHPKLF